jgi:hypothetical protein
MANQHFLLSNYVKVIQTKKAQSGCWSSSSTALVDWIKASQALRKRFSFANGIAA